MAMTITERQKDILFAIIRAYIKDAEPVGSKTLAGAHNFGIGPAMIRQEMATLEREGYIEQPHISAGRIPTDKAYRLYISELDIETPSTELSHSEQMEIQSGVTAFRRDTQRLLEHVSKAVSELSGDLSVAGRSDGRERFAHGFSNLAEDQEFKQPGDIQKLLGFMDEMDRFFEEIWGRSSDSAFRILIGEENPIEGVRNLSVITGQYRLSEGQRGFVSIIGPRRMDYGKNVAVIRYVQHVFNNRNR